MNTGGSRREFLESLRDRLSAEEFSDLLRCLDPELRYELELDQLTRISPEQIARWDQERAELQKHLREREHEGSWCDPFITRLPPPRRTDLDVDDVTDLLKYVYATLSRAIADLQYYLAELAGTGRLDPEANDFLQFQWCAPYWDSLFLDTVCAVRNEDTDHDWDIHDNTYSTGRQVMSRVTLEPLEIADDQYPYNQYLCADGPIQHYPQGAVAHIAEPPLRDR